MEPGIRSISQQRDQRTVKLCVNNIEIACDQNTT